MLISRQWQELLTVSSERTLSTMCWDDLSSSCRMSRSCRTLSSSDSSAAESFPDFPPEDGFSLRLAISFSLLCSSQHKMKRITSHRDLNVCLCQFNRSVMTVTFDLENPFSSMLSRTTDIYVKFNWNPSTMYRHRIMQNTHQQPDRCCMAGWPARQTLAQPENTIPLPPIVCRGIKTTFGFCLLAYFPMITTFWPEKNVGDCQIASR